MSSNESENDKPEPQPEGGTGSAPGAEPVAESTASAGAPSDEGPADETAEAPSADESASSDAEAGGSGEHGAPSPGQRIAAQRAAKAAKKAAEKARRKEDEAAKLSAEDEEAAAAALGQAPKGPDEFDIRAEEVGRRMEKVTPVATRTIGLAAAALVVLGAVGYVFKMRDEDAGRLLAEGVEASAAEVGPAPESDDGLLRFATEAERTREALRRYRKVIRMYEHSDAAVQARLAIATQLLEEGKFREAKQELDAARRDLDTDQPEREVLFLELAVLARFGLNEHAAAQADIDRIGRTRGGTYRPLADYLSARSLYERGQRDQAKQRLVALVRSFDGADAPVAPHVRDQARALLAAIDPSAVPAAPRAALEGLEGLPPEILQQLQQLGGGRP